MPKVYISPSTQENNVNKTLNYVEETEMNLIADILEVELQRHNVTTYRNTPDMNLTAMIKDSDSKNVDFHLAIHSNAGGGKGAECYICAKGGRAEKFANEIYNEVAALTPHPDRGVKVNSKLSEIQKTKAPAVLVELDFHDNDTIAKWIQDNRRPLAIALCKGILKEFKIPYEEETSEESNISSWIEENGIDNIHEPNTTTIKSQIWAILYRYHSKYGKK